MFEGVPNYPTSSRFWEVCDKHQVNICYTAPTAIRALMREGDEPVKKTSRKSIRLLGSVGEPINPEAWEWYYRVVGDEPLPDRRYLVADGDRRHPDHAAARRHQAEARLGDAAVLRHSSRQSSTAKATRSKALRRRQPGHHGQLAGPDAHGVRRSPALCRNLLLDVRGQLFRPATARAAMRTVTTGSRAASTT